MYHVRTCIDGDVVEYVAPNAQHGGSISSSPVSISIERRRGNNKIIVDIMC